MRCCCHSLLLAFACCGLISAAAFAQEAKEETTPAKAAKQPRASKAEPANPKGNKAATKSPAKAAGKTKAVSAEREAELLEFVNDHHPELAALLKTLKTAEMAEYQAAVSDLDRDIRRLEQTRKRSPAQFDTELAMWVVRSRIRLLSAQLSMSDDPELREELRIQLRELRRLELAAVQQEIASVEQAIEKQQQRLKKLEQRLTDLQSNDEDWLARQLSSLEQQSRNAEKQKNKPKPKSKTVTAP